jgi:probable HAF family extracellular repeat protein
MNIKDLSCLALTLIALGRAVNAQPLYQLTNLGILGSASGINASGQVIGEPFANSQSILYSGGVVQSLGIGTSAHGINDSGQVVGEVDGPQGLRYAFLYSGGATMILDPYQRTVAYGINDSGQIVGATTLVHFAGVGSHAIQYIGGVPQDLTPSLDDNSVATAINASGQVVGYFGGRTAASHAFLYTAGVMQDLGTLGGSYSAAYSINASGQVVGQSYTTGATVQHAFLDSNGTMTDLGTFAGSGTVANGINDSGEIVGTYYYSYSNGANLDHPFLDSGGTMYDLNALLDNSGAGWTLVGEPFINDNGWIAADGIFGGNQYIVLLSPVPEPSSLVLGLLALGGLPLLARLRKRAC